MSSDAPDAGRPTLRRRLTIVTASVLALALAGGAVLLVSLVTRQRIEALDEAVTARVQTVHELLVTDRMPETLPVIAPGEVVQVLDPAGGVLATSPNASLTLPIIDIATLTDAAAQASGTEPVVVAASTPYAGRARVAVLQVLPEELPVAWQTEPGPAGEGAFVVAAVPSAEVAQTGRTLTLLLLGVVPVLVLGLALVVWVVLGRALRPVEDLRSAAASVAATGGPGSLPVPDTGELAALARTLNQMLDRLDGAAAAERAAAGAARAAADRQRAFVADAAHELRSPLASLVTSLEVAGRHPDAYPPTELLADLETDVRRIQVLVEDLLLLARVGSRPLRVRDLDLLRVATAVADEVCSTEESSAGPAVDVTGAGHVRADGPAVERVVRNLIANAVRHARTEVSVVVGPGAVVVEDDGDGIAPEQRERVFERFVRLDEARERDAGGSGLGLAIARELAREQGGDVTLDDAGLGGLRATLTLGSAPERDTETPH